MGSGLIIMSLIHYPYEESRVMSSERDVGTKKERGVRGDFTKQRSQAMRIRLVWLRGRVEGSLAGEEEIGGL